MSTQGFLNLDGVDLCDARHTIRPIQTADRQPASSTQETP